VNKGLRALSHFALIVSLGYITYVLSRFDWTTLRSTSIERTLGTIGLLSLFYALSLCLLPIAWSLIISLFASQLSQSPRPPVKTFILIYNKANLMKYLPTSALQYMGRQIFAGKIGLNQKELALSSVLEVGSIFFASLCLGIWSGLDLIQRTIIQRIHSAFASSMLTILACAIASLCIGLLLVAPELRKNATNQVVLILNTLRQRAGAMTCFKILLLQMGFFLNMAITVALIYVAGLGLNLTFSDLFHIGSGAILAWTMGFIAIGTPGGIGVREASLLLLLGPTYGQQSTMYVIIVHRLITTIGDCLGFAFAHWFASRAPSTRNPQGL
jgi:hypothetical protein